YISVPKPIQTMEHRGSRTSERQMRFLTLAIIVLVPLTIGTLGLVAFAYLGDLSPHHVDITEPVAIDAD
ncbi:MAG: hypothetical protein OXF07_12860, partial [Rhodobacter sp.]|nr:hypothetical protein [Rhodobacter sp.]